MVLVVQMTGKSCGGERARYNGEGMKVDVQLRSYISPPAIIATSGKSSPFRCPPNLTPTMSRPSTTGRPAGSRTIDTEILRLHQSGNDRIGFRELRLSDPAGQVDEKGDGIQLGHKPMASGAVETVESKAIEVPLATTPNDRLKASPSTTASRAFTSTGQVEQAQLEEP